MFPWAADIVFLSHRGELSELGRTSSYHALGEGSMWRASASVSVDAPDDAESCAGLVDFLHAALDASNPAFGRIEWRNFSEVTNLDAVLRRKKRTSLRESRRFLRATPGRRSVRRNFRRGLAAPWRWSARGPFTGCFRCGRGRAATGLLTL